MNFKNLLPSAASHVKILAHVVPWFGNPSHRNIGYNSNDPAVIARQLALMQICGVDGVVVDWYGSTNKELSLLQEATALLCSYTKQYGMLFCIMLDKGIAKWPATNDPTGQVVTNIKANPGLFTTPNYLLENYVLEFDLVDAGVDLTAVQTALSSVKQGLKLVRKPSGYTWISTSDTLNTLKKQQSAVSLKMACAFAGFNDQSPSDCTKSVWGGAARRVDPNRGNLLLDSFALCPDWVSYLQLVTWNDYEEGTALEQLATQATGFKIA